MLKKYKLNRAISSMVEDKLYEMALNEVDKGILKKGHGQELYLNQTG